MGLLSRTSAVVFCVAALATPRVSFAQGKGAPKETAQAGAAPKADDPKARALKHFERARELYRDGSYKEALGELEQAHELDPDAKDLVYNLAIVAEKLGNIDDALRWMRRYTEMDIDAAERSRAELAIRRLEGAKRTLAENKRDEPLREPSQPSAPAPERGVIDAWTIGTGAVAVVGLGIGTVFGIDALSSKPKAGFVTGQNGTYTQLAEDAERAHSKAVVADVGFGVFVAGATACGLLYFLRTKPPKAASAPQVTGAIAPSANGMSLVVGGAL